MRAVVHIERWGISTHLRQNADRAERALAARMLADMDAYVPSRSGATRAGASVQGNRIVYRGPYAGVLYRGRVQVDPETRSPYARPGVRKVASDRKIKYSRPCATAYWLASAKRAKLREWQLLVAKEVTRGLDKK